MATFRGQDGFLALGGVLVGTPTVRLSGALSAGVTTMALGAATTLLGAVVVGDTFTIAGEAGSPVHTVTGQTFRLAAANAITGVTFTPAIATGGVALNAAVTFASSAVVNARLWNLSAAQELLDGTTLGMAWKAVVGGMASWTASTEFFLDRSDPEQVALLDALGTTGSVPAIAFGVKQNTTVAEAKFWYASATISSYSVGASMGSLVTVTANLTGTGALLPQWG